MLLVRLPPPILYLSSSVMRWLTEFSPFPWCGRLQAGTALTLVGGIPTWLERRPEWLGSVLALVLRSLQDPDDTVVRNAASTFQRLAASRPVALALLGDASDAPGRGCGHAWQQLHAWLLHRGGLARRSTVEKELSSEQARRPAPTRAEQCLARVMPCPWWISGTASTRCACLGLPPGADWSLPAAVRRWWQPA